MAKILILGATGYIGGRLVPRLLAQKHEVCCLVRSPKKTAGKHWDRVRIFQGDVLQPETFGHAFDGIDLVFYLIHSMTGGGNQFEDQDRTAAENVASAAHRSGVKRIVYLGGLGKKMDTQSPHLKSRHEVGDILRTSGIPVTELRASVIIGPGSASFEMIHHLVNRLPIMICPRWVNVRTQPIGIDDVLSYLVESVENEKTIGQILDIGAPEILTYKEMMLAVAGQLKLKRYIFPVPLLTPKLSSYWMNLITPIPVTLARSLIESLRYETVCENQKALELFSFTPTGFEETVRRALEKTQAGDLETKWTAASAPVAEPDIDSSHLLTETRVVETPASAENLFRVVASLGGENGWLFANWLWRFRGFLDKQLGGVGLRRGRRHASEISVGEALDFWRVEDVEFERRLLLRAEMKVPGRAWLEYQIEPTASGARLTQTAKYYPKGLIGLLYWFLLYPVHRIMFYGLAQRIVQKALSAKPATREPGLAEAS
jgi:uncharacterized protein YbjT (DUF2867 family)